MSTPETPAQDAVPETPSTPAQDAPEAEEVLGPDGKPYDPARAFELIRTLREENKALKPKAKLADELTAKEKERADAELSEAEKQKKRADEAEARAAKLERETSQMKAASEAGLPPQWFDRLKGATYDEMLADAQELAKTLPTLKVAPKVPATNPNAPQTNETEAQQRERLFGPQRSVFDMSAIKAGGGGVVWVKPPE